MECNICGWRGDSFGPLRSPGYAVEDPNVFCPSCGSYERHRALALFLDRAELLAPGGRALEIGNGMIQAFRTYLEARAFDYVSLDLWPGFGCVQGDALTLPFGEGAFDLVISSHVLEHVTDDFVALGEMVRVLAPHGTALLQVPFDDQRFQTVEERKEPTHHLGSGLYYGHAREYGLDVVERFAYFWPNVVEVHPLRVIGEGRARWHGCEKNYGTTFVCGAAHPAVEPAAVLHRDLASAKRRWLTEWRAYRMSHDGSADGAALDNWLRAEREVGALADAAVREVNVFDILRFSRFPAAAQGEPGSKRVLRVRGARGLGKTSLLRMCRQYCRDGRIPAALARAEEARTPIELLAALGSDLSPALDAPLFPSRLAAYRGIQRRMSVAAFANKAASGVEAAALPRPSGNLAGEVTEQLSAVLQSRQEIEFYMNAEAELTRAFTGDLARMESARRIVLLVDSAEWLAGESFSAWLRTWLGSLPANVLLVVAGRDALEGDLWLDLLPDIGAIEVKPLRPNHRLELIQRYYRLIAAADPDLAQAQRIAEWSKGSPLSMVIATGKWASEGGVPIQDLLPAAAEQVERVLLAGVSADLRATLEAAAVLRRFDRPALRSLVSAENVQRHFEAIKALPVVEASSRGWSVHESLRSALAERLRTEDSDQFFELHRRAAEFYRQRLAGPAMPPEQWRLCQLELLYHEFEQPPPRGLEAFREAFERAFFVDRQFDLCKALLAECEPYRAQSGTGLWLTYYEGLMAMYLESDADKSREILESLLPAPGDSRLAGDVREYLASVYWYYQLRVEGGTKRALELYQECLRLRRDDGDKMGEARVLIWMGILSQRTKGRAESYFKDARRLVAESAGNQHAERIQAWADEELGIICRMEGRFQEGEELMRSSLSIFRKLGRPFEEAGARLNLGMLLLWTGRLRESQAELEATERYYERTPRSVRTLERLWPRVGLAELALQRGDPETARRDFETILAAGAAEKDQFITSLGEGGAAVCAVHQERWSDAMSAAGRAERLQRAIEDRFGLGLTLHSTGQAALGLGDFAAAETAFVTGLTVMRDYGSPFGMTRLMTGLCRTYCEQHRFDEMRGTAAQIRAMKTEAFNDCLSEVALLEAREALEDRFAGEEAGALLAEALRCALEFNVFLFDRQSRRVLRVVQDAPAPLRRVAAGKVAALWREFGLEGRERDACVREGVDWGARETFLARLRRCVPDWKQSTLHEAAVVAEEPRKAEAEPAATAPEGFDVFISYNRKDQAEVLVICERLKEAGIRLWIDTEGAQPGVNWRRLIENAIRQSRAAAVFLGAAGIGGVQEEEMNACLNHFPKLNRPVIPVLLRSAGSSAEVPLFLDNNTRVDFRTGGADPVATLLYGITGRRVAQGGGA